MKSLYCHSFRGSDRANDGSKGKCGGSAHSDDSRSFLLQAIRSNSHASGLFVVVINSFLVNLFSICCRAPGLVAVDLLTLIVISSTISSCIEIAFALNFIITTLKVYGYFILEYVSENFIVSIALYAGF
jgi:hypothetical protein